jgi:hypothetical protein
VLWDYSVAVARSAGPTKNSIASCSCNWAANCETFIPEPESTSLMNRRATSLLALSASAIVATDRPPIQFAPKA